MSASRRISTERPLPCGFREFSRKSRSNRETTASPGLSPASSPLASCCRGDSPADSWAPVFCALCAWLFCVLLCSVLWYLPFTCPQIKISFAVDPRSSASIRGKTLFHALSNPAYFSPSFFNPNLGNCTVILAFSPSPSRWYTTPSPNFGCFTRCPGRNDVRLLFGSSAATCGLANFFPREAKNSAMLSMELYLGPEYPPVRDFCVGPAERTGTLWSSSS